MRHTLFLLLLLAATLPLPAQRVSRDYRDQPMTSVLADLSRAARQRIVFIYNDLEDYLVTQHFDSLTVAEAIRVCIGHYPVSLTVRGDSILLVECTQKRAYQLTGRITDPQGRPVADASITLLSPADSAVVGRGVSTRSGYFAVPADLSAVVVRFTHVAYQPVLKYCQAGDVGIVRLVPATVRLDGVSVVPQAPRQAESRYYRYAEKIEQRVWSMEKPQFHVDTLPARYRSEQAVVLADYDCIEYSAERRKPRETSLLVLAAYDRWVQTKHLHRTRYYINHPEAARRLANIVYSRYDDITDNVLHKVTVVGVRVVRPDGSVRLVNTRPYFQPRVRHRQADEPPSDTLRIGHLEQGDILDVFVYHNFKEALSPHLLTLPAGYPVVSYEGRAVADDELNMVFREGSPSVPYSLATVGQRNVLLYQLQNCDNRSGEPCPRTVVSASLAGRYAPEPARNRRAGVTANPDLSQILSASSYTSHLQRLLPAADAATQATRQEADSLYRRAGHIDAFAQALRGKGLSYDVALTTRPGSCPIDLLTDAADLIWFIRLKDGSCYFYPGGTPSGRVPAALCGQRAVLSDWKTFFTL